MAAAPDRKPNKRFLHGTEKKREVREREETSTEERERGKREEKREVEEGKG